MTGRQTGSKVEVEMDFSAKTVEESVLVVIQKLAGKLGAGWAVAMAEQKHKCRSRGRVSSSTANNKKVTLETKKNAAAHRGYSVFCLRIKFLPKHEK